MNRVLLTLMCLILTLNVSLSQDIIFTKSAGVVQAKIIEISPVEIKYKKFDNLDGPTFIISKTEVTSIQYQNGTKDVFILDNQEPTILPQSLPSHDLFMKGASDAAKNYTKYHTASSTTLIVTLIFPPAGLVSAIITSSIKPKEVNLDYPKSDLMKLPDYSNGYKYRAKKIKQGKVWGNFGIAVGINIVIGILITAGK